MVSRKLKALVFVISLIIVLYGAGRLYYGLTGGFTEENIKFQPSNPPMAKPLSAEQLDQLKVILGQKFSYLGKGCQSYVFQSEDKKYVIKFIKYQRFKIQPWMNLVSWAPGVESYKQKKIEQKNKKLETLLKSWKTAYEVFPKETGVVYVHVNKTPLFTESLRLVDKLGFDHAIDLNGIEFLVQKSAHMLCPTLDSLAKAGKMEDAQKIISDLLDQILAEYQLGFADNDHALMQNTGIIDGKPAHIDVGQFIHNNIVKDPSVWKIELFNKTYKFKLWLKKKHPLLAVYLENRLQAIIGEAYSTMQPYHHQGDVAKIPND